MAANTRASQQSDRQDLERRVHIDLPRVLPEEMGTTQDVEPSPDPHEGRDAKLRADAEECWNPLALMGSGTLHRHPAVPLVRDAGMRTSVGGVFQGAQRVESRICGASQRRISARAQPTCRRLTAGTQGAARG